ncbi:expressed unknown protein [Seminavis robusta]|uniref:Uncharacterized protein n=1 Tax=Seminavis robusta TaxID=568900 RepID=A0A9N8DCH4_9STRA|nr:expressed unknown protein [Seminavis robusta]|eukprot:Sro80_g043310.1 n/a (338) ;mRNA; r:125990-127165
MDDNHFLIEWLAYHFYVMPMRRLIILVDPGSMTTPQPILDRWKDWIDVTVWHEEDIFPNGPPTPKNPKKNTTKLGQHRARQRTFLMKCLQQLHKERRGWVFVTDTDEYTMVNDLLRDPQKTAFFRQNVTLPEQSEPGSIMKLLKQGDAKHLVNGEYIHNMPCITMARRTFSTKEMKNSSKTFLGYTKANFQTLHWKYYDKLFKPGKALVNLKKIRYRDINSQPSVHRPISNKTICTGKLAIIEQDSIFAVNHYPGNLHQMLFRKDDARGAENNTAYRIQRFNDHKKIGRIHDTYRIEEWLKGFIAAFGEEKARQLLEHVGLPEQAAAAAAYTRISKQ